MAQVFPVLMLAIVWESAYLERLRGKPREHYRFWTMSRVRAWTILVIVVTVLAMAVIALVLADVLHDSGVLRGLVLVGLACVLGTLLVRGVVDTVDATSEKP